MESFQRIQKSLGSSLTLWKFSRHSWSFLVSLESFQTLNKCPDQLENFQETLVEVLEEFQVPSRLLTWWSSKQRITIIFFSDKKCTWSNKYDATCSNLTYFMIIYGEGCCCGSNLLSGKFLRIKVCNLEGFCNFCPWYRKLQTSKLNIFLSLNMGKFFALLLYKL